MTLPEYGVPDYVRMARHEWDLSDDGHEVIELAVTNETDTDLRLAPDGTGGVEFVAGSAIDPDDFVKVIEGGQDTIEAHGAAGSTETIDPTDGNVHTLTLTADCTITLNAPAGSGAATLEVYALQDGTGGWDITWPGSVVWPGGTPPAPDTTLDTLTRYVLETLDGGTTWYGVMVGGGSSGPDLSAIDFLVGTASGDLSAEIAVGTTPGGELGGTWASPTVDATHAGSTHIALSSTTPLIEAGSGSAGSGTAASKDDHVHPAASSGAARGAVLLESGHAVPFTFDEILQASDGSDFLYASA